MSSPEKVACDMFFSDKLRYVLGLSCVRRYSSNVSTNFGASSAGVEFDLTVSQKGGGGFTQYVPKYSPDNAAPLFE